MYCLPLCQGADCHNCGLPRAHYILHGCMWRAPKRILSFSILSCSLFLWCGRGYRQFEHVCTQLCLMSCMSSKLTSRSGLQTVTFSAANKSPSTVARHTSSNVSETLTTAAGAFPTKGCVFTCRSRTRTTSSGSRRACPGCRACTSTCCRCSSRSTRESPSWCKAPARPPWSTGGMAS